MGKKCIPGLFCIENMTLFLLIVILIMSLYLWYTQLYKPIHEQMNEIEAKGLNTTHSKHNNIRLPKYFNR